MVDLAPGSARSRWQRSVLGRFPGLGKLTVSSLLSETADEFASVALIWIVLVETGSPALAGLAVLFRRAPEIVSGPLLGAWFDRWSPVKLTAIGFAIRGIAIGGIALLSVAGTFSVPVVLALCLVMGITNPLAKVGTRVITPMLIPRRELQVANGVLTIGDQFPYLVGPVLGGSLAGFIGIWSLFIPAIMCLVATVLVLGVRVNPALAVPASSSPSSSPAPKKNSFVAGFGPLITVPVVRAMMILTVIYFLSYGPLLTAIPVFSEQNLGAGGAGYGAMWSAMGVGALLGLVMVPRLAKYRPAVVNAVGATLWGLILLPLVFVHELPLALVIMFVGGFVWAPYASTEISVIQNAVTSEQYGAVFGARRSVIVASSPTGAALGGLLLEHFTGSQVVALSGLACVLGGALCLCLPSVRAEKPVQPAPAAKPEPEPEPV
ncbi:MFS transporter [Amycolatopsis sp.]|uniref:MFS transporter n=1 Tax=Amycolatopsis sp. TaxID=37632 RepID=UPI002D7E798A|nr:MFS transporter [Amycolatopsis sp.]HET6706970.1 MFS transporter [Amycolatopsis sp.]